MICKRRARARQPLSVLPPECRGKPPAEDEARRRGCDRVCLSSFTFQAPGFYQKYGYAETGRTLGIPGGGEDIHMFKRL